MLSSKDDTHIGVQPETNKSIPGCIPMPTVARHIPATPHDHGLFSVSGFVESITCKACQIGNMEYVEVDGTVIKDAAAAELTNENVRIPNDNKNMSPRSPHPDQTGDTISIPQISAKSPYSTAGDVLIPNANPNSDAPNATSTVTYKSEVQLWLTGKANTSYNRNGDTFRTNAMLIMRKTLGPNETVMSTPEPSPNTLAPKPTEATNQCASLIGAKAPQAGMGGSKHRLPRSSKASHRRYYSTKNIASREEIIESSRNGTKFQNERPKGKVVSCTSTQQGKVVSCTSTQQGKVVSCTSTQQGKVVSCTSTQRNNDACFDVTASPASVRMFPSGEGGEWNSDSDGQHESNPRSNTEVQYPPIVSQVAVGHMLQCSSDELQENDVRTTCIVKPSTDMSKWTETNMEQSPPICANASSHGIVPTSRMSLTVPKRKLMTLLSNKKFQIAQTPRSNLDTHSLDFLLVGRSTPSRSTPSRSTPSRSTPSTSTSTSVNCHSSVVITDTRKPQSRRSKAGTNIQISLPAKPADACNEFLDNQQNGQLEETYITWNTREAPAKIYTKVSETSDVVIIPNAAFIVGSKSETESQSVKTCDRYGVMPESARRADNGIDNTATIQSIRACHFPKQQPCFVSKISDEMPNFQSSMLIKKRIKKSQLTNLLRKRPHVKHELSDHPYPENSAASFSHDFATEAGNRGHRGHRGHPLMPHFQPRDVVRSQNDKFSSLPKSVDPSAAVSCHLNEPRSNTRIKNVGKKDSSSLCMSDHAVQLSALTHAQHEPKYYLAQQVDTRHLLPKLLFGAHEVLPGIQLEPASDLAQVSTTRVRPQTVAPPEHVFSPRPKIFREVVAVHDHGAEIMHMRDELPDSSQNESFPVQEDTYLPSAERYDTSPAHSGEFVTAAVESAVTVDADIAFPTVAVTMHAAEEQHEDINVTPDQQNQRRQGMVRFYPYFIIATGTVGIITFLLIMLFLFIL